MKRIFLFLATNRAVMLVLSVSSRRCRAGSRQQLQLRVGAGDEQAR